MTNCFVSGYRRKRRYERYVAETRTQQEGSTRSVNDPREQLSYGLGDEVAAALGALAPVHREVVELADIQGVQYKEIARELDVPIGTVMSRLFRARRQLERDLHEYAPPTMVFVARLRFFSEVSGDIVCAQPSHDDERRYFRLF